MKLTQNNYFSEEANREYFSVSQFKQFMDCEAQALASISGEFERPSTTSLLVGSYVDAHFSGEIDRFIAEHPEIVKRDGTLKSDYTKANGIIERVSQDELFVDYLNGEQQVVLTGELFGYYWKIKVDALHEDKIVDLKIMKDFENVYVSGQGKLPFIEAWGYDIQGAVYQAIVEQNVGKKLPFYIAAATKESVTDYNVFSVPQTQLDLALKIVEYNIDRFADVKSGIEEPRRCGKCDYCKQTKKLVEPVNYQEA